MKINIWGNRGSIPSPSGKTPEGKERITHKYGGDTTCIEVIADDGSKHILDAGSGIRELGNHYLTTGKSLEANLYITHTHWDHIQGLPFFTPAYIPGNKIAVFGEAKVANLGGNLAVKSDLESAILQHSDQAAFVSGVFSVNGKGIKEVLQDQMAFRNFPAPLDVMKGIEGFYDFMPGATVYKTDTFQVDTLGVNHPGGCISYRLTEEKYARLNRFMPTWGHSDYKSDLIMATEAEVKHILLGHHEPKLNDNYHDGLEIRARQEAERQADTLQRVKPVQVDLSQQGMSFYL